MSDREKGHSPHLLREEPSMNADPRKPALFRPKELKWSEGTGTLKGHQVAIVNEDQATGAKAMFVKLPANKAIDPAVEQHYHTATAHTIVVQGSVSSIINGKKFTVGPGDYFRAPAGWVHGDSHGGGDPHGGDPPFIVLFMIVEGQKQEGHAAEFETVAVRE
jgi:mannose-6-phosphate isomerase-like protein (cupin superfamily)